MLWVLWPTVVDELHDDRVTSSGVDEPAYIELLREYDKHRDVTDLAAFVESVPLDADD